jgi:Asp-tRNA(Asn)/Glu-tRNA(Gln) amidotransferase A subunit family amidase
VIDEDAFVYQQLKDAVLIAKLSMGELAMDDIWFGGQTKTLGICNKVLTDHPPARHRQPLQDWYLCHWYRNLRLYCSTLRCGATGLRPTFGSVARGMNLAWTSDRIGPICRSAEDCAMVFASIHGSDTYDRASRTMPLTIRIRLNLKPKKWHMLKLHRLAR